MSPEQVAPVMVRPGTTDVAVFGGLFIRERLAFVDPPWEPKVIIDAGAYTGLSTRWLCDRFPKAVVIGIEPVPQFARLAQTNAPRSLIREAALGGRRRSAEIQDSDKGDWACHIREDATGVRLGDTRVITFDDLGEYSRPDLVKLDVEGSEKEIFEAGPLGWLESVGLLFIEIHDRFLEGCGGALFSALDRVGRNYEMFSQPGSSVDLIFRFEDDR